MNTFKKNIKIFFAIGFMMCFGVVLGCNSNSNSGESTSVTIEKRIVQGVVKSGGSFVSNATVKIRNTNYQTTTNSEGEFEIVINESVDELGDFRLIISCENYIQTTKDVLVSSFSNGRVSLEINILSSNVVFSGTIKDKENTPLEGVQVSLLNTDYTTTTDENGNYFISADRPMSAILELYKDYYKKQIVEISDCSKDMEFKNDVILEQNYVSIKGFVSNNYEGKIADATVAIKDTNYTTKTNSDGSYTFKDVLLKDDNYEMEVSKSGYLTLTHSSEEYENLEIVKEYYNYANINLDATRKLDGYVTRSSEGLYFKYLIDDFKYEAGKEEKVQVYINPGKYTETTRLVSEENPNGGHAIEIALTSNNGIAVFVNYYKGVTFVSNILWGNEVSYTVGTENGKVALNLFVKYSVFKDYCGEDFAMDSKSVVGVGLNFWSDFTDQKLYSWYLNDMLGADGTSEVYHDNPADWPRLDVDGQSIYEGSSNTKYDEEERIITGKIDLGYKTITQNDLDNSTWATINSKLSGKMGELFDVEITRNGNTFVWKYTGKSTELTDNDEFWNFISFDNCNTKFDIRFKNGWAGVYNWKTGAWEAWNEKIGNATYERNEKNDLVTVTMVNDLSYFTELGFNLDNILVCPVLKTKDLFMTYERINESPSSYDTEYVVQTFTDDDGFYRIVIPADKINVDVLNVLFTKNGYQDMYQTVTRDRFVNSMFEMDTLTLVEGKAYVSISGYVSSGSNALSGVTVTIQGTDITTLTDENGKYSFENVEYGIIPFNLVFSKKGYYNEKVSIEKLVTEENVNVDMIYIPVIDSLTTLNVTNKKELIGTLATDDNVKVYVEYVDGKFNVYYEFVEGAVTLAPEELLKTYFSFKGSDTIYYIACTNKMWVGIFNEDTNNWETWNEKIANPIITTKNGITTIMQSTDLSYFSDLGEDISEIYVSFAENTADNDYALKVEDKVLSTTDKERFFKVNI